MLISLLEEKIMYIQTPAVVSKTCRTAESNLLVGPYPHHHICLLLEHQGGGTLTLLLRFTFAFLVRSNDTMSTWPS